MQPKELGWLLNIGAFAESVWGQLTSPRLFRFDILPMQEQEPKRQYFQSLVQIKPLNSRLGSRAV